MSQRFLTNNSFTKNFFFSSRKIFLKKNFQEFDCLGILITEANTIKWRYASAFADCWGEFPTLFYNNRLLQLNSKPEYEIVKKY